MKSLKIAAGWLIDGTGGPVDRNVTIEISDGRIAAIGDRDPSLPCARQVLDLSGCTLIPALIDCHVHLAWSGNPDPEKRQCNFSGDYRIVSAVITTNLEAHERCGVAALRDGGDCHGHLLRYQRQFAGKTSHAINFRTPGLAWHQKGRYGRIIGRCPPPGVPLADAITAQRGDHIKIVQSGLNSLTVFGAQSKPQFDLDELRGAVDAAAGMGLSVMGHANGRDAVRIAIEAGVRSIEHGFFMGKENLRAMADAGIVWVPTACTMKAYASVFPSDSRQHQIARQNLESQLELMHHAKRFGVQLALGTDAGSPGVHHGHAVRQELGLLIEAGFSVSQAIRCATVQGANLLGYDYLGPIVNGKRASLLAVNGPPENLPESLATIRWRSPTAPS